MGLHVTSEAKFPCRINNLRTTNAIPPPWVRYSSIEE
jgi:hypothetical protein